MPELQPRPGILDIVPYVPGNVDALDPDKVVYLASNESPLGPSPAAVEAYRGCGSHLHQYPDAGATALREAIGEAHGLDPARIVCGPGSERLIDLLTRAYAGPGDEVLYSRYGFIMYPICTHAAGATPVAAPERDFTVDVDALLDKVTASTRIVFLANPNNPTGTYLPAGEVRRLREGLPGYVLLVVDSAYAEYVDADDYSTGDELVDDETGNVVVLRTFSKIYGLASLRLGWAHCPSPVAGVLNRIRGSFSITGPGIAAGVAALGDTAHTAAAKRHNSTWRPWLAQALAELGLNMVPSAGNFVLARFQDATACQAAHQFLTRRGVILRPVGGYGLPEALRITVGTEQQNRTCVEALQAFMSRNEITP